MLARSRQLEGIFGLLKPFLHVQILICFVDIYQNHGVLTVVDALVYSINWVLRTRLLGTYIRAIYLTGMVEFT